MFSRGLETANTNSKSFSSSVKAACLECRQRKVTCKIGESARACQRCENFGLQCRFEPTNKRGRKHKNQSTSSSTDDRNDIINYSESSHLLKFSSSFFRNRNVEKQKVSNNEFVKFQDILTKPFRSSLWRTLMRYQAENGHRFILMYFGEGNKKNGATQSINVESSEDPISSRIGESLYHPTLRQVLCPLTSDKTIHGRIIADLPLVVRFDIYPDPRVLGIITSARCEELLLYYDTYLQPWAGVIPSAQELSLTGTRWTSTFLLSTVLYLASRFSNSIINSQEEQVLGMHTRSLAIRAFGCADQSLETLTALHLLTVWKALDDGYSQLYVGYADQIANISRTGGSNGSPLSEKEARDILRIQLFHYVQRSTFQLFYVPLINEIMDQDGFILPFPISSPPPPPLLALERFAAGSSTLLSDWQLCATVEGRSIQTKYRDLLEKHKPGRFGRSRNLSGEQIALLEAFFCEMEAWEYRWRRRRSRISESKISSRTPVQGEEDKAKTETERYSSTTIEDDRGWIKFEILGNSICLHISSLAFRQCIEVWFEAFPQTIFQSIEKALAEMIRRTYQACIDSAIGLLERIVSINPLSLVHMPDTDFIMINYAAMFIVYLLLLPSEIEDYVEKPSSKHLNSKEEYLINLLNGYTTKSEEYLGLITVVKDVVERASQTRPESTCCFLSSEQFKSLVALFEPTIQSPTLTKEA